MELSVVVLIVTVRCVAAALECVVPDAGLSEVVIGGVQ
jgi:hypothetical protein